MEVARTIFSSLAYSDLQTLERGYQGHCHPLHTKPKHGLFSFSNKVDKSLLGLPASKLPGARPRTEIVLKVAAMPKHPKFRKTTRTPGSAASSNSKRSPLRYTPSSSGGSSNLYTPEHGRPFMVYAVPVPVPVYCSQSITFENGTYQKMEQVHMPYFHSARTARY
jgi:hypothetical protein